VEDEGIASCDPGEEIEVAFDEFGFGDDAEAQTGLAGEDFEERTGDFGSALDGLIGIGGGADGDRVGGVVGAEFLLEEPGSVFLEEDEAFEEGGIFVVRTGRHYGCGRWGEEFVGVTGVAVAASKLASAVGIDGVGEPDAAGGGLVEDGADFEGAEFDVVTVGDVGGFGGHAGEAGGGCLKDGEERFGLGLSAHMFAFYSPMSKLDFGGGCVKENLLS